MQSPVSSKSRIALSVSSLRKPQVVPKVTSSSSVRQRVLDLSEQNNRREHPTSCLSTSRQLTVEEEIEQVEAELKQELIKICGLLRGPVY